MTTITFTADDDGEADLLTIKASSVPRAGDRVELRMIAPQVWRVYVVKSVEWTARDVTHTHGGQLDQLDAIVILQREQV